jgi:UDP-N-acetylmuramoyl-tripeptide--D-alanyl-D-alanine ligase
MTPLWTAEDVVRLTSGQCLHEQVWRATGVACASERTESGDLFIAGDDPASVAKAFARGAVAALVERRPPGVPEGAPLIFVPSCEAALKSLAMAARQRGRARFLAASAASAMPADMAALMLGALAPTQTGGNDLPLALTLAHLQEQTAYGVFTLAADDALGRRAKALCPDVALVDPTDTAALLNGLAADGIALLPRDSASFADLAAAARAAGVRHLLTYGRHRKSDARLMASTTAPEGQKIDLALADCRIELVIRADGEKPALAAAAALLAVTALGADPIAAAEALTAWRIDSFSCNTGSRQTPSLEQTVDSFKRAGTTGLPERRLA